MSELPVLWLCGTVGAGKSVTGWSLFQRVASSGVTVAYVDIDQLGMLYPESDDDPERYALKTQALAALVPQYAAAGAQALVISGILDPEWTTGAAHDLPGAAVTFCLLDPGEAALRERIVARGWDPEDADEAVADNAALRTAPFVDHVVDTDGMSVNEVTSWLRESLPLADRPASVGPLAVRRSASAVGVEVITGPRVVGTSTVGFGLARAAWSSGVRTGFADIDQLSFLAGPCADDLLSTLGAANLAALHEVFGRHGAERFVVSAHLIGREAHDLVRDVARDVTIIRLRAHRDALEAHLEERTHGSEARLAGDDLVDASPSYRAEVLAVALSQQAVLDAASSEDHLVDVSHVDSTAAVETSRTFFESMCG